MKRLIFIAASFLLAFLIMLGAGCDKEKIVESTEYVHDIEYVELPPDTVYQTDTVYASDTVNNHSTDTVYQVDTAYQIDTVYQTNNIYDTVRIYDTVNTVEHEYDTIYVTDTIETTSFTPNEHTAYGALQYYTDDLVLEFIYDEFAVSGGWVFYMSEFQLEMTRQSTGVYDFYGYIDYWTTDWASYYPLEFYFRMTYVSGDPSSPLNWDMTDPPSSSSPHKPGISRSNETAASELILH